MGDTITILAIAYPYDFNGWSQATVVLFVCGDFPASARAVSGLEGPEFVIGFGANLIITQARAAFPHFDVILQLAGLDYLWV